jgi:subtilisin family serine protease
MKSTRRKGLFINIAEPMRRRRAFKQSAHIPLLDQLESRMLLSTTATISWNGISQKVNVGEYVFASALGGNIQARIASTGLNVAGVKSLGSNYYELYDYADSVASVNAWANAHLGLAFNMFPNHPQVMAAVPSEMAGANINSFWYFNNTGQVVTATGSDVTGGIPATQAGTPGADINALNAWNVATGRATTIVAVLDTGINYNDPDLINRVWNNTNDPWTNPATPPGDGVDNDLDGVVDDYHGANFSDTGAADDPLDDNGHGTLVSGLIAAQGNGGGPFVGVNWTSQILPVKVLDSAGTGSDASILAGLNYVIMLKTLRGVNITVMNMSLGRAIVGPANGVGDPGAAAIFDALDRVGQAGIITVVAAGNDGVNLTDFPDAPASSNNDMVLTVAATDNRDNPSIFTNFGDQAKLAAPGQSIAGLGPDNGGSGTSFAAPLVTGAVALLHSLRPDASPQQLVNAILQGVDVKPQLNGYVTTSGRLNVANSLEILMGNIAPIAHVDIVNSQSVIGWMMDPNLGSAPMYGQLIIDGKFVSTFLANQNRPDLLNVVGSTNHGFTVKLPLLAPGPHKIQIVALDVVPDASGNLRRITNTSLVTNPHALDDTNSQLLMRPIFVNIPPAALPPGQNVGGGTVNINQAPIGFVDFADPTHIVGWAFDKDAGALPVNIVVYIDGKLMASGTADINRPDLAKLNLGSINHGFDIASPSLPVGPHRVSVYALDTTTGQATFIGSRTLLENQPLNYFVDNNPLSYTFTGYVFNPDDPSATVNLEVIVDGTQYAYYPTAASQNRNDVPISNKNHGFNITISALSAGVHFVQLVAYHPGSGIQTIIDARYLEGNRNPVGSFVVNNTQISGYVYDDPYGLFVEKPHGAAAPSLQFRMDVDGQRGSTFTQTLGTADNAAVPIATPAAPNLPTFPIKPLVLDWTLFGATASVLNNGNDPEFGARNTLALQTAIDDISKNGGGTVFIGAGTWYVGHVTALSNVTIDVDSGAILRILGPGTGVAAYGDVTQPFIKGVGITNFEFTGAGELDANSVAWGTRPSPTLFEFDGSSNIYFHNANIENIPGTVFSFGTAVINNKLIGSSNVVIDTVNFLATGANSQGILINGGHDFLIENMLVPTPPVVPPVTVGLSFGREDLDITATQVLAQNIVVKNNTFGRGPGLSIGTNVVAGVDTVIIDGNTFSGTTNGLFLTSSGGIGGVVQNIVMSNNTLSVQHPFWVVASAGTGGNTVTATTPLFQGLYFLNNTVTGAAESAELTGLSQQPLEDINFFGGTIASQRAFTTRNVYGLNIDPSLYTSNDGNSIIFFNSSATLPFGGVIQLPQDTYHYSFPTPTLSAGTHLLQLYAINPTNGDNVLIRTVNLVVPALSNTNTQPFGAISSATGTLLTGYALDPNSPSAALPVEVDVDGTLLGNFTAGQFTANLPFQFGPNHGFNVPLNLTPGRHVITVYATDTNDPTVKVLIGQTAVTAGVSPAATITLTRGDFIVVQAFGFANAPSADWTFRLTVDGLGGNTFQTTAIGTVTNGLATIIFKVPPINPTFGHNITVDYIDPATLIPITLAQSIIQPSAALVSAIGTVNSQIITGYVYSRDVPTTSLSIYVQSDGLPIRLYTANIPLPGIGNHGFAIPVQGVPAGRHLVRLFAVDPATGFLRLFETFVLLIPQP